MLQGQSYEAMAQITILQGPLFSLSQSAVLQVHPAKRLESPSSTCVFSCEKSNFLSPIFCTILPWILERYLNLKSVQFKCASVQSSIL